MVKELMRGCGEVTVALALAGRVLMFLCSYVFDRSPP